MTSQVFLDFVNIVKALRAPDGCPWDREQTFASLTPYIIEEAYELVDAIQGSDVEHLKEELGDVLLHVVMLSNMAEEQGWFSVSDVIQAVHNKMIRRHPHVFGELKAESIEDVWENWESVKKSEKKADDKTPFEDVPRSFPALLKSQKIAKKIRKHALENDLKELPESKEILEKVTHLEQLPAKEKEDTITQLAWLSAKLAQENGVHLEDTLQSYNNDLLNKANILYNSKFLKE